MAKILVLTNHSYMLYRFRLSLLQTLAKEHEVVLSMPFVGHEADFAEQGFRCIETAVDRRGINPATDFALFRFYRRLLKQEKPDFVITYSIKPNIYGGYACRLAGIPCCANVQGLGTAFQRRGLAALVTSLYRVSLKRAHTVFFENQSNAQQFLQRRILPQKQITVLKGAGIDLQQYTYQPYPENDPFRFLYLGRIMREKGMEELFAAVKQLQEEGFSFVLDLVGFFEDTYKDLVQQLQESGIVRFHGFQEDPVPYYVSADCVVLPSYHEGMSNVLLEAAAIGRPVITSDIPGCREAVDDGETGLLCAVRDPADLCDKMRRMLILSAAQRQQMGKRGAEKMRREFDKNQVVQATMNALPIGKNTIVARGQ